MSKKIILNDKEVVFNEDVSAAQDWRSRDFNRLLEAMRYGTFENGPLISGQVVGACVVSGLELIRSGTNLDVLISGGTGLFGFGGTDSNFENNYQLSSSENTVTLSLPVAVVGQYRYDLIEVSAEQITTTEVRKVLRPLGPTQVLQDTVVPKIKENRLKFRVRSGTPNPTTSVLMPALQPDPAWLPLYAIRVDPGALHANSLIFYDLRLWLRGFSATGNLSTTMDKWGSRPELVRDSATTLSMSQNTLTTRGYTAPVGFATPNPARMNINVNVQRPAGVVYVVDQWYYLYAVRPNSSCGFVDLTLSPNPPPIGTGLPNGIRFGLAMPAPWPTDGTAVGHYLGAVRLYSTGGGNFAVKDFYQAGSYVAISGFQEGVIPPGANTTNQFVVNNTALGSVTCSVNPGVDGPSVIPSHVRMIRALFTINGTVDADLFVVTKDGFVLAVTHALPNSYAYLTVDIPLPADGSTQLKYTVTAGLSCRVLATVLGYYEGLV